MELTEHFIKTAAKWQLVRGGKLLNGSLLSLHQSLRFLTKEVITATAPTALIQQLII